MAGEEQRASERILVRRDIELVRGSDTLRGATENLSLGGALVRIAAEPPLRAGERLGVSFTLPGLQEPVRAEADVRWVNDVDRGLAGIQFLTGFRAKETWALHQLINRLKTERGG